MSNRFIHFFIPLFIVAYFAIAFYPILRQQRSETLPFFSFKLYSKVPDAYVNYDLLYNQGEADESFLIKDNHDLNKLERKNYGYRLRMISANMEQADALSSTSHEDLLSKGRSVHLVKLSGNYLETVRDDDYNLEVIKKLK
jgi:hypothetical protein